MTNTQHVTRVHAYLRLSPHVSHRVGLLAFRSLYFGRSLARRGGPSAGAEERQWNPGPCVVPVAAPPACSVALARKGGGLACGESRAAPGPHALRGPASPLTGVARPVGPAYRCGLWPCSRRWADSEAAGRAFRSQGWVGTVTRGAGARPAPPVQGPPRPRGALLLSRPPSTLRPVSTPGTFWQLVS